MGPNTRAWIILGVGIAFVIWLWVVIARRMLGGRR